ncbi:LPD7 domain-containing protein [Escherichia coli]|nr:LPD7 domain-containing protein [Escherichia coli]MDM4946858.1 hypothetical protein [Escherichia coli]WHH16438.1 hypothetical protein QDX02_28360 [Escherichia coli]
MDGKKHRIRLQGDTGGKKSGSYVGHLDGHPNGWFNDFRDGGSEINATWSYSGEKPDPVAALHIKAVNAQEAWNRAEQTRLLHDQKARTSAQRYKRTAQAGHDHPYLQKKGVQAARGVHIDNRQGLVIPLYNTDGQIRSIQTIDPEGNKRLAKDAEKAGNFFVVGGSLKDNHPIVLAEGYATAASCAMALRHPVVMTVDSGNLVKVAENLHARYPGSPMLFLGDDDLPKPGRPGNPGKEAAEKAARLTRGTAFVPHFTREEREQGLTDFNDLHQARGLAALTEQLTPVWQQVLARCPAKENIVKETPDNQATPVATNAADMPEMNVADNTAAGPAPAAETATTDIADNPAPAGAPEMNAADNTAAEPAPAAETVATDVADTPAPASAPEMNAADNAAAEPAPAAETVTTDLADTPAPAGGPETNAADNTAAEPAPAAETVATDVSDTPAPASAPEMNAAKAPADTDDINARLAAAMEYEDDEAYGYYDAPSSPVSRTSEAETQAPVQEDAPLPFQPPKKKQASPDTTEPDGIRIEKPPVENAIPSPLHDLNAIMKGLSHPYKGMDPKDIKYPLEMFLDGKHVFTDFVTHLTMASQEASRDDRAVLAALLTAQSHCQLKGEIELTGSDEFKQRAITLIATYDLKLKLKNPEQVEMLNQARARLQSEPVPGAEAEPLSPDANHILWQERSANVASAPQQSALPLDILPTRMETALPRNASHKEASCGITGQLLAFGPAHYNFDKQKDRSYYAHLRTRHGERLVWGIGLQEAIRNSGLKTGDMATLTMLGKKPVTVQVKKLGDDGKPLQNEHGGWIYEEKEVTRNQWEARPAVDPYVVARHTGQLAQPGELRPYHLGDYRALQAAVDDMARKAGTTPPTLPAQPEVLWVQHNGQGVTTPRQTPASPELPAPHPEAGKLLMQLQDEATQQLKLLLVKARGDFVQGLVLHEGRHKPVLGRFVGQNGERHLILNEVTPQGLRPIGKGNAINNETGNYNSFVFTLKGERERILTQVTAPEKRPAALQQELGFSRPPVPPEQVTEMRNKPQNAPRRNHNAPRPGV